MSDQPPKVVDAEFELISVKPFRFPWGAFLWWAVYTVGCCVVAYSSTDPGTAAATAFGASLIVPAWIALKTLASGRVSQQEADLLRRELQTRRGKAPSAAAQAKPGHPSADRPAPSALTHQSRSGSADA